MAPQTLVARSRKTAVNDLPREIADKTAAGKTRAATAERSNYVEFFDGDRGCDIGNMGLSGNLRR